MAQNIIHYSADALTPPHQDDGELRHGAVCIRREDDGSFVLLCANPIESGMGDALRAKLDALRSMTLDEIKKACRQSLREDAPEGSKGAMPASRCSSTSIPPRPWTAGPSST
jgi:hypothetical protein